MRQSAYRGREAEEAELRLMATNRERFEQAQTGSTGPTLPPKFPKFPEELKQKRPDLAPHLIKFEQDLEQFFKENFLGNF